jgi:hypothetical protein
VAVATWPAGAIRHQIDRFSREARAHTVAMTLLSDPASVLEDIERARSAHRSGSTVSPDELDKKLFG